jgi:hypothetical protein
MNSTSSSTSPIGSPSTLYTPAAKGTANRGSQSIERDVQFHWTATPYPTEAEAAQILLGLRSQAEELDSNYYLQGGMKNPKDMLIVLENIQLGSVEKAASWLWRINYDVWLPGDVEMP